MEPLTLGKTVTYTLQPTAEQEGTMALVVRRCRERYHAGVHERRDAWQQGGVSRTAASPSAPLPPIKEVRPESRESHSPVVQDLLTRLGRTCAACFPRVQAGGTPGSPRVQGGNRSTSFPCTPCGRGAPLDNGFLA